MHEWIGKNTPGMWPRFLKTIIERVQVIQIVPCIFSKYCFLENLFWVSMSIYGNVCSVLLCKSDTEIPAFSFTHSLSRHFSISPFPLPLFLSFFSSSTYLNFCKQSLQMDILDTDISVLKPPKGVALFVFAVIQQTNTGFYTQGCPRCVCLLRFPDPTQLRQTCSVGMHWVFLAGSLESDAVSTITSHKYPSCSSCGWGLGLAAGLPQVFIGAD